MTAVGKRPHAFAGASLRVLLDRDITLAQLVALIHIGDQPGIRVSDVASAVRRSVPATGRLLESLVQAKLVTRSDDPGDRRVRALHLTAEGEHLVKGLRPS